MSAPADARGQRPKTELVGPERLFARYRALVLSAFLFLIFVAVFMVAFSAQVEERQERTVLTEKLRAHAFLLDSQALVFRQSSAAITRRLNEALNAIEVFDRNRAPWLPCQETDIRELTADAGARIGPVFNPERAAPAPPDAPPLRVEAAGQAWRSAVAQVAFAPHELSALAPNLKSLVFYAPDGGAAAWLGRPAPPAMAPELVKPASCADNPTDAPVWAAQLGPARDTLESYLAADASADCAPNAASEGLRFLAPVYGTGWRSGVLALELDTCRIRRAHANLNIPDAFVFLVGPAANASDYDHVIVGEPGMNASVAPLAAAALLEFDPVTLDVAEAPFGHPAGDLTEIEDRLVFVQPLRHAPGWALVASLDYGRLQTEIVWETSFRLAVLLVLVGGTLWLVLMRTRRGFLSPAQALVADIVSRGAGEEPPEAKAPQSWMPYFSEIRRVFRENAAAAALRQELAIAARMQASILPTEFPASDARLGLFGSATPAQEVGGDFFDIFELADGRTALVIADVSGKGVPAAMFMTLTRTLTRAIEIAEGEGPAKGLEGVNRILAADNAELMFVTLFIALVDPVTGRVAYANAGHNPPYQLHKGAVEAIAGAAGMALGVFEEAEFEEAELTLAPGDALVLFTDGVTEAMDPENAEYGENRLEALLDGVDGEEPEALVSRIAADVGVFANGAPQADDLTMLVARLRPAPPLTARIAGDHAAIGQFAETLEVWAEGEGAPPDVIHALNLSLDELITNALDYGGEDVSVDLKLWREGDAFHAEMQDNGRPFDPLVEAPAPDLDGPVEERELGGFGVHFVKTLTDAQSYERRGDKNVVTIIKRTEGDAS